MFSPNNPFGTSVYLFEELWLYQRFNFLQKKYPHGNWDGLINKEFLSNLPNLLKKFNQEKLLGYTSGIHSIQEGFIKHTRRKLNLLTSHAPSREIALNYLNSKEEKVVIINIDAHLDFTLVNPTAGNVWITPEIAKNTIQIGGWEETIQDIKEAKLYFRYIFVDFEDFLVKDEIINYLSGAKVYITIDLDFFCTDKSCRNNFLGISNYFHRQRFIGHAKTIDQILSEKNQTKLRSRDFSVLKEIGINIKNCHNLNDFRKSKSDSVQKMTSDMKGHLSSLLLLLKDLDARILSLDVVEYSPSCDWENISLNSLLSLLYDLDVLLQKLGL